VPPKKDIKTHINTALAQIKAKKRLTIIEMPEEMETSPHWLLWLAVLALVGLVVAIGWQSFSTNHDLQAYLPFL
jgi:hypothetical protein